MHCDYEVVNWNEVRDQVKSVNPEFYELAEAIGIPDDDYLYKVCYSYGCEILKRRLFHFPNKHNKLTPLDDSNLPEKVKEDLGYAFKRTPLTMVLSKSVELFIDTDKKLFPWQILTEGKFLAVFSLLEESKLYYPPDVFSITAGARNVFMLPNIGDKALHQNLKNSLGIKQPTPKKLVDHWPVFRDIYNAASTCKNEWTTELLLFPKHWIDKLKANPEYKSLYAFIANQEWRKTVYSRHKTFFELALSEVQEVRNLKPDPYLLDTVKHIFATAAGGIVGFQVALDEQMLPLTLVQNVYDDIYKIKEHTPIIFQPGKFDTELRKTTYYSLQFPTTLEFAPRAKKDSSTLHELLELKHIISTFLAEIEKNGLPVEDPMLEKVVQEATFQFFHSKPDKFGEINSSSQLLYVDSSIERNLKNNPTKSFPSTGTFARGCITIN